MVYVIHASRKSRARLLAWFFAQQSIDINLEISINNIKIIRSKYVKYLGLWLEDDLKFYIHISDLATHLAKYIGMCYRIRTYLKIDAMITLFYSFIYSKLQYGILTWGSAKKNELGALSTSLNKMIKTITFAKKFSHVSPIFKAPNFLKIGDNYQLELGKFMCQTFNDKIPPKTDKDFIKLSSVHKHYTRHTINKFHLSRVNTCYGHKILSFAGVKLWSKLDPCLRSLGWLSFKKHYKRKHLEKYDD